MNENENLSGYVYDLPEGKIANYPTSKRSDSKLLYYDGTIQHSTFKKIDSHLPKGSLLVFNDTKVIPARILFTKSTGALIEVFLLNPVSPSEDMAIAMAQKESCTWKCFIGNMKRWKNDSLSIKTADFELNAKLEDSENQLVKFSWTGQNSFGEILEILGNIPLPPYIKRKLLPEDKERYQTIYSAIPGAVAAPTAGLHFTNEIMSDLKKNHKIEYVTLHVGAGTFQPVKTENFMDHEMHSEVFIIKKSTIQSIIESTSVISVG
ncbi:MAG: S-adenosylmethionine:tRNA ribosyltransferase-isomerase, partial [Cyclobacteriaceae bacterium]|nr:S-adenosylmethionine:tRNA ribosyltransferase-isomerase [Cyclobacteriaceae bacterium]